MTASPPPSWLLTRPPVPDSKTFEIALTLGGTVSAGAYTAGAIDFLIQALDCWEKAAAEGDPMAPTHNAVIKVVTGTSGGAVIAATMARALAYDFPPVDAATIANDPPKAITNPFYRVWNKILKLDDFLATTDIVDGKFLSILNPSPINEGAVLVSTLGAPPALMPWRARRFIASPLQVILTLTNVSGIPFKTSFGALSQTYVNHADYAKFAVAFPKMSIADPTVHVQWSVLPDPDQFALSAMPIPAVPQPIGWLDFAWFAVASAAFPLGFPARPLKRPADHYKYRVVSISQPGGGTDYITLTPDWGALKSNLDQDGVTYKFLSVDGGATDNEPIELARTALCGYQQSNPRSGVLANRAVVLIDPFAGEADLGPADNSKGLFSVLGGVLDSLTQQTRYETADLLLAADPNVFSRFMLTAQRDGAAAFGGPALASAGLDAFIGFACEDFAAHDYILGRKNCQDFLKNVFVLDKANPIMQLGWSTAQIAGHRLTEAQFLPIIPLMREAAIPETLLPWPKGALDPEDYRNSIAARFAAIVEYEGKQASTFLKFATWLGANLGENGVASYVINRMNTYLADKSVDLAAQPAPPSAPALQNGNGG